MAGRSKDPSQRPRTKGAGSDPHRPDVSPSIKKRSRKRTRARREALRVVIEHAALAGNPIELGVSTADALQGCLDRVVALWRHAASEVDALAEDEVFTLLISSTGVANEVPNVWIQHEAELRKEIEHLAATMTGLGIAERRVRIEEAQAALLVASIRDAAVEAGISHDQIRLLGEHLRARLDQSKVDIPPSPRSAHSQSQDPATSRLVASTGPSHGPSGGPDSSPSS